MIILGSQLSRVRASHANERIVLGTGCFDVRHPGHIDYLAEARSLGNVVVMSILGDRKLRQLKKGDRPAFTADNRAVLLDDSRNVDYVTVEPYRPGTDRASFFEVVTKLRPSVFIGDETWVDYVDEIQDAGEGTEFHLRRPEKTDSSTDVLYRVAQMRHLLEIASALQRPA